MFLPLATQFAKVKVRLFFSPKPPFVGGSKPQSGRLSSFYPSLYLCVSILHILIATPRPFTLTVSNGIACRGRRPRSRSCKCTAHVCTNSPIDASLAPVSGRIEPSTVLFLSEPYLDSLKVLEIELEPDGLKRTSVFNRDNPLVLLWGSHNCAWFDAWSWFKCCLELPNIVQTGVTPCKDDSLTKWLLAWKETEILMLWVIFACITLL